MNESPRVIEGAFVVGNLIGIPSCHYDPAFARVAEKAIKAFRPSVVALELPDWALSELEWAASCWPTPVVSAAGGWFLPFVPGDSMFETFRLARAVEIPVALIDLPTTGARKRMATLKPPVLIGAELSRSGAKLFLEAFDSWMADSGPPDRVDVAREAYMAQFLTRLLAKGETVMWVGGMGHWTRIVDRINSRKIGKARVRATIHADFKRMRLAPSALYQMTQRLPWLVAQYAQVGHLHDWGSFPLKKLARMSTAD